MIIIIFDIIIIALIPSTVVGGILFRTLCQCAWVHYNRRHVLICVLSIPIIILHKYYIIYYRCHRSAIMYNL